GQAVSRSPVNEGGPPGREGRVPPGRPCLVNRVNKEDAMLKKIILAACVAAVLALALPSRASAYGAAHVGYTHVGPNGVYHTGETVARGPGGTYGTAHTGAYGTGGGAYHAGYGGAYHAGYGGAYGAAGGYRYTPSYGGASYGAAGYHYGYV